MSRPKFPSCIMPVAVIRGIRQDQEYYDKNPERAEREQKAAEERRQEELRQEREEYERQQETEK